MRTATRSAVANSHGIRISVVQGQLRIAKHANELLSGARESVWRVGRPPVPLAAELDSAERDQLRLGVRFRTLHERASLSTPDQLDRAQALIDLGEQARIASGAPLRMLLVDHDAALLPLTIGDDAVRLAAVARGEALICALDEIFEELWRTGTPFEEALAAGARATRPTEEDSSILSLLAAGATDEGIGRRLGISARTAHRRVRELMARLGAQTRFQAGAQAVRIGWL